MKPHIKRLLGGPWMCEAFGRCGFGQTPSDAFAAWRLRVDLTQTA